MEDGSFNNEDDEEIKLEDKNLIGLISPIEINRKITEKWQIQLNDYEIVQPFNQLSTKTKKELIKKFLQLSQSERLEDWLQNYV